MDPLAETPGLLLYDMNLKKYIMKTEEDLLSLAVINQIEKDLEDQDYESLNEMLLMLMKSKESKAILIAYLSDEAGEKFSAS